MEASRLVLAPFGDLRPRHGATSVGAFGLLRRWILPTVIYIRYESPTPNSRGAYTGIFGLANGLARSGRLSPTDWGWWRSNNDWFDAAYPDPATVDPTLFEPTKNPIVTCWFKDTATHLLDRVDGYLGLLQRHDISCVRRQTPDPGLVLYDDAVQVVVAPRSRVP